ncbi:MAG: abortive infection system antitoxin AbiGi family protein [Patescibacteria group bacterium]
MYDTIHSKFLIHWTGKDINPSTEKLDGEKRAKYLERLNNTLKAGLYMKPGEETIQGVDTKSITAGIARVCFTEIKLTQTEKHAKHYGSLGIGFNRNFVLEREGNPVFYVQNGDKGHIIENLVVLRDSMNVPSAKKDELEIILGYLKGMSCTNETELKYYDEMEWRIVHIDRLTGANNYIYDNGEKTKDGKNIFRLKLKPEDIQLIIFPDNETKRLALKDEEFFRYFNNYIPTLIALDDCKNF